MAREPVERREPRLDTITPRRAPAGGESLHVKRLRRVGAHGALLEAAADPSVHFSAEALALRIPDDRLPGRPPKHAAWALVLFGGAKKVYGSALAVAVALRDPGVWETVVAAATPIIGELAARVELENGPPTLSQWNYFQKRVREQALLPALHAAFEESAAVTATEMGVLPPTGRVSVKAVSRANVIAVDGKNHTSPSKYNPRRPMGEQGHGGSERPARRPEQRRVG